MIIDNKEKYINFLNDILSHKSKYIGIDTETEAFTDEKQIPWELALEGVGIYINKKLQGYILPSLLDDLFQEVIDSKICIFHNAKFDLEVLESVGFNLEKVDYRDTMLMSWLCNENRRSHRLKDLAQSILKVEEVTKFTDITEKPKKDVNSLFGEKDYLQQLQKWIFTMGTYCKKDCEYTYKLYFKFEKTMEKDNLIPIYKNLELPFVSVLKKMEMRGIKIDKEYLKNLGEKLDRRIIELGKDIYKKVGRDININSPKQLSEYFFIEKKYTLPDNFRTPKGDLSTNVSALKYLAEKESCQVAKYVLEYRELAKLNSTYVKGLLSSSKKGIIHAGFRQIGTVTGRLSSSKPNLQNIPRRDDELNIRKAFIPREGYNFILADYSQVELRLMAYFAKDERMLEVYKTGGDIHQATADEIGCSRTIAKTINFGINYGRTAYGMSEALDISVEESEKFINKYFAKYPKVKIFIQQATNTIRKRYAVYTLLRRKRRFPEYPKAKKEKDWKTMKRVERQATNSIIQGSASDVIKVAMRNLSPKLEKYDSHILVQIHDELLCECPIKYSEKVKELIKYEMENCIDLKIVNLTVEPKITHCWEK
ncbi:MAG: hypothetical protein KAT66_00510 [Candidatus Lokiarchaeota archaeon]|nr:hypothetical protein [Candidatus Lokiarchaeota archaeon]